MAEHPVTVIGIGNPYRGDDRVGLYVAEQVRNHALKGLSVVEGIGDGFALIDAWAESDLAIVIDCASSGSTPGTTFRFDAVRETIPGNLFSGLSTHSISVNEAIDLARVLNRLPKELVVYGIEGENFSTGLDLAPVVEASAHKVVESILEEIETLTN